MGTNFLNQVLFLSLALASILFLAISFFYSLSFGLGVFVGTLWAVANLLVLKRLIYEWLSKCKKGKFYALLALKVPLLYFIGYVLLKINYFSSISLLLGYQILIASFLLKAVSDLHMERVK